MDEFEVAAFFEDNTFSDISDSEDEEETVLPGDYYQSRVCS